MFFYNNIYFYFLLSASLTNIVSYFYDASSIVYIAWVSIAMYSLFKFFECNNGDDGSDDKEKKKERIFRFFCLSTVAALTAISVISWTYNQEIPIEEIISSSVNNNDVSNEVKKNVNITYDLSQFITEDMKVDRSKWDPDFDVSDIDYNNLGNYSLSQLEQVIEAYEKETIPYDRHLFDILFDYVVENYRR